ncbi:MAG: hypothetical protein JSS83_01070 [Cyanobacteria bacterium SZAS LIN-3]|nr:hypothetical protein [Cyanobacteria bacterium SZAS LIN-3]MBS2010050.1 hypothetical protein [Cyanobacteria bacterium SZAS TMP-1]
MTTHPPDELPNKPIIESLEQFQPRDERDSLDRAIFFATATAALSANILTSYIKFCLVSFPDENVFPTRERTFNRAAKEILTINIWLTMLETCGDVIPEWYRNFIHSAFRAADELAKEPPVADIFEFYPIDAGMIATLQTLSLNLCHKLDLGATRPEAVLALGDLMFDSADRRHGLLQFSLTQPLLTLDAWVADLGTEAFSK